MSFSPRPKKCSSDGSTKDCPIWFSAPVPPSGSPRAFALSLVMLASTRTSGPSTVMWTWKVVPSSAGSKRSIDAAESVMLAAATEVAWCQGWSEPTSRSHPSMISSLKVTEWYVAPIAP